MSIILHIETSTRNCSVALSKANQLLGEYNNQGELDHSSVISVYISKLLEDNHLKPEALEAIALSKGPGSYTGLRIGTSVAKGICYALNIPLIAISTLHAMARTMKLNFPETAALLFCPMLDARRMEVYCALYSNSVEELKPVAAKIVEANSFGEELKSNKIVFFGDGSSKCKEVLQHPNAQFIENFIPKASHLIPLASDAYLNQQFENTAYFEPFYLKEFIAGSAKSLF